MKYTINTLLPDFISEQAIKKEFQTRMSAYLGCEHVIPVVNGTMALEVALRGLGLHRGDAVIVPDISFIATATAVANCGLVPVYADVSYDYFGLTLETLRRRITPQVKAVVLVHFSGFANRAIFAINEYCQAHGIALVEDCAQALGCSMNGKKVGTFGHAGAFSFQTYKIINCGEGGVLSTDDKKLASICEAIGDWGISPGFKKRRVDLASSNFRLSAIQCYFLNEQIKVIKQIIADRLAYCRELEKACQKYGVQSHIPVPSTGFYDVPFFFPVKSGRNLNMIEPREESPLHQSLLVVSILKRFYPDLLASYRKFNPPALFTAFNSNRIISDIDFINIHQAQIQPAEQIIFKYKE